MRSVANAHELRFDGDGFSLCLSSSFCGLSRPHLHDKFGEEVHKPLVVGVVGVVLRERPAVLQLLDRYVALDLRHVEAWLDGTLRPVGRGAGALSLLRSPGSWLLWRTPCRCCCLPCDAVYSFPRPTGLGLSH